MPTPLAGPPPLGSSTYPSFLNLSLTNGFSWLAPLSTRVTIDRMPYLKTSNETLSPLADLNWSTLLPAVSITHGRLLRSFSTSSAHSRNTSRLKIFLHLQDPFKSETSL